MKSIIDAVKRGMCCKCGNCVAACGESALGFSEAGPFLVEREKCTGCGNCVMVCPAIKTLDKPEIVGCYAAFSKDREVRWNASSGGFVTQLLVDLLVDDIIDAAIVCDYRDDALKPQAVIATTREDIVSAASSKYCPVPMNIVLKDIPVGRYAFVGLPCHIKGLRLRQKIDPQIREMIKLTVGLFCNHTPDFNATKYLLQNLRIDQQDVQRIRYRGQGWPGIMQIVLKDGQVVQIENAWKTGFGKYFVPKACSSCTDMFSDYADVSVGDPWLKEYEFDTQGTTLAMIRDHHTEDLVKSCSGLSLTPVSYETIYESQKDNFKIKKRRGGKRTPFISKIGRYEFLWRFLFGRMAKRGNVIVKRM